MKLKSIKPRTLSVFTLVMINVIAVDSIRNLPISAEYGFSIVVFYAIVGLLFFVPSALISAELATGWPKTGGAYVWVREAFGLKTGFLLIWLQWIYNVVWYPTILAFIAATLAYLFNPHLADNRIYLLTVVLTLFWAATIANMFGMRLSGFVSILCALIGTLTPMLLIIVLGGIWIGMGNPLNITFSKTALIPDFQDFHNLAFLTAVIFGLMGMEMSATHAEEVKNPQRDYPRALLYSTLIIIASLVLASLAIAIVVPKDEISLVTGMVQAFSVFFNEFGMNWMLPIVAIFIIIGGLGGVAAWIIGPTKGLMVSARDGCLPPFLTKTNRYGVPVTTLIMQGIIFTLLCSIFVVMPTINSSYWVLSDLAAQLALLFYIILFAAAIRLRYKYPDVKRSFKIPFGNVGMWICGTVGIVTSVAILLLGFYPPSQISVGEVGLYELILVTGIVVFCIVPFIIYHFSSNNKRKSS